MFFKKTIMLTIFIVLALTATSCAQETVYADEVALSSVTRTSKPEENLTDSPESTDENQDSIQHSSKVVMPAGQDSSIDQSWPIDVYGWLGSVVSLPAGAQYDDKLVLYPEGTGEIGITGQTSELENEIRLLRDKEMPGKYAHFWGKLICEETMDVNGCQLIVSKIRSGASQTEPEQIPDLIGQLARSFFNGGDSLVFVMEGRFPMQFSIQPASEEIKSNLENALMNNDTIQIKGQLFTGIPDVNGSRINVTHLEILGHSENSLPDFKADIDPTNQWNLYTNELAGYQIRIPSKAIVIGYTADHFPPDELPALMSQKNYLENLQKKYGDQLCLHLESGLGYVNISSPQNEINRYVECRNSDKQNLPFIEKSEKLEINETIFSIKGYEVNGSSEKLSSHYEYFSFTLSDGTYIEYGSSVNEDANFSDYLMKGHEIIREIIKTYSKI